MPRGEIPEQKTDAYISGVWYTIARNQMKYNSTGKQRTFENLAGQLTSTAWDCCFAYANNNRGELTNAIAVVDAAYSYDFDDIGNRLTSLDLGTNRTYTANNLNQYTQISNLCDSASLREEFLPQFDEDGNQALIQTATGIWFVTYNGENRPVLWSCGATNIVMSFDRIGRRVLYLETSGAATNSSDTFTYDNYLCVARHRDGVGGASATDRFVWNPTEPVATRPLVFCQPTTPLQFYTHDGNKNVSEIVFFQQDDGIAAHYEYAPFGAVTATGHTIPASAYDFCEYNSFRFSSEYYDILISLHSYNFRCYDSLNGRWCTRDMLHEQGFRKSHEICKSSLSVEDSFYEDFQFVKNAPLSYSDYLGLKYSLTNPFKVGQVKFENCSECQLKSFRLIPEHYSKGEELKVPNAGWNSSVDGVWVEGIQKWLKIPNHCYATIICSKGCDFEYRWKCNAFLSLIQKIRGKIYEVDFVPDQGETNHPTNYPF